MRTYFGVQDSAFQNLFCAYQVGFLPESCTSHPSLPTSQMVLVFRLWKLGFDSPKSKRKHQLQGMPRFRLLIPWNQEGQ